MYFARDGRGHGLRSERRADVEHAAAKRILPQRDEEKRRRLLADAGILRVFGDADELHPASLELEALAERAAALPVALGHGFVDNGAERGFFVIGEGGYTTGDKRNAYGNRVVVAVSV